MDQDYFQDVIEMAMANVQRFKKRTGKNDGISRQPRGMDRL